MKIHSIISGAAAAASLFAVLSVSPAQADTVLYPTYALKSKGIDMRTTEVAGLSPDNKLLCCLQRFRPKRGEKAHNTFYIIPVSSTGNLGHIRVFPVEGITNIDQVSFTPDSKSIVFASKLGATLTKMDCKTGEMTTIMEHEAGKPGFMVYPMVLELSGDKLLAMGYHYNSQDFVGPQAVAEVDTDKTGLDAFVNCHLIDHVQYELHKPEFEMLRSGYPALNVGFVTGYDLNNTYCDVYSWDGDRGVIKLIDECKGFQDQVYGGSRTIYSVQEKDGTWKLCIYDAKTDEKVVLASGQDKPYYYPMMSEDGTTITVNVKPGEAERYNTLYARESEGWELKPIDGLEKRSSFGRQRLSYDGSHMVYHNADGIRIVELKASRK